MFIRKYAVLMIPKMMIFYLNVKFRVSFHQTRKHRKFCDCRMPDGFVDRSCDVVAHAVVICYLETRKKSFFVFARRVVVDVRRHVPENNAQQ